MSASSQTHPPEPGTPPPGTPTVRPISALDVPLARLEADIEQLRQRLPLDDPDRHALDLAADARFNALVTAPTGGAA